MMDWAELIHQYGLSIVAIIVMAIFIQKLVKDWRADRDKSEARYAELTEKVLDTQIKNTDVLSGLKTLLETTRERK